VNNARFQLILQCLCGVARGATPSVATNKNHLNIAACMVQMEYNPSNVSNNLARC
jgi:hypothetical protein